MKIRAADNKVVEGLEERRRLLSAVSTYEYTCFWFFKLIRALMN